MTISYAIWALVGFATATGLVAGVFLAFSDFVMKSLFASEPAAGTEAMQIINRKVYSSLFMVLLIGMILASVLIAIAGYLFLTGPVVYVLGAAGALYFFGVFIVSFVGNIPMNRILEAMPQAGTAAQAYWPRFVKNWVRWNHLRWISAAGTMVCYIAAAVLLASR